MKLCGPDLLRALRRILRWPVSQEVRTLIRRLLEKLTGQGSLEGF